MVKIYEGVFDASQPQMANWMTITAHLSETSAAWGTSSEEIRVEVSF